MDPRLVVPDTPRPGVPPGLADLPLFTLAWRALKAEAGQNSSRSVQVEEARLQEKKRRQALLVLANEIFRLRNSGLNSASITMIERIENALLGLGVEIVAPVGEVYSEGLMEVLDNLAQQPTPGLDEARVQEVIVPTILLGGDVVQIGKAVIAVPEPAGQTSSQPGFPEKLEFQADRDRRLMDEMNRMGLNSIRNDKTEKKGGENG